MTKIAQDLGYATAEQIVQDKGLAVALQMVTGATDGTATGIGALIPNARALPLVLAAVGGQSDVLTDKIGKMNDRFGATDNAVKNVQESVGQRMAKLKSTLEATLIKVFEALEPVIGIVVDTLSEVMTAIQPISKLLEPIAKILKVVLAPILKILGELISGILIFIDPLIQGLTWLTEEFDGTADSASFLSKALKLILVDSNPIIKFFTTLSKVTREAKEAHDSLIATIQGGSNDFKAMEKVRVYRKAISDVESLGKVSKETLGEMETLAEAGILDPETVSVIKNNRKNIGLLNNELRVAESQYGKTREASKAASNVSKDQQEILNTLIAELKKYKIEFEGTGTLTEQITQATDQLDAAMKRQASTAAANAEKTKEFREAEKQATEELARMDYEAGRTSLAQYTAHLTEKMNAIKGNSQQEILARLQIQKEIDDLNKEALEKDLAISALRTSMLIEMAEEERDKSVAIYGATLEQKLAAGDNYWSLRKQQIRETAAKEEQTKEELALYLQQLGIERAAWEQEQRDADVAATEDAEAKKLQARKDAAGQALDAVGNIAASITSIYDSEMQKQIEAIKARGLSEEEEQAKIAAVTAKYEKKKQQIAKIQKAVKVSQAISNTAVAATEAFKLGPILGPIMAGVITTMGMAQVAAIMAQPYYRGGIIKKGQVGFIEGYRDEAVNIPLRGEGSFEEVARVQLIPELMRNMRGTDTLGKPVEPSRPAMKGGDIAMTNISNFNGAVLNSDVTAINEWQTRGAKKFADKLLEAQKSLG
jgi:hypothetical protein